MLIGQAYTDILTSREQQALQDSCNLLIDSLLTDLPNITKPEDVTHTMLGIYLPERYLYKYTPSFVTKFLICIITVNWKLAQPERILLSSLAEELAVWVIIQEATRQLEEEMGEEAENTFDAFIDEYFEDTDFEYLYDDSYDGIDETELAKMMGISSLAFKDWFLPFSNEPSRTPHPYVLEDDAQQQ